MERSPSAHRRGRAVASLAALLLSAGTFTAIAQVSPCTSSAGQLTGQSVTTGAPVYYSGTDLSAGGGSSFSVNTNGQGSPTGNANVAFESSGKICLGPGFQAAASGGGFHAFIGTIAPSFTMSSLSGMTVQPGGFGVTQTVTITTNPALSGVASVTSGGYPAGVYISLFNAAFIPPSSSSSAQYFYVDATSSVAPGTYGGTVYITVGAVTLPFTLRVTVGTSTDVQVTSGGTSGSTTYPILAGGSYSSVTGITSPQQYFSTSRTRPVQATSPEGPSWSTRMPTPRI